MDESRLRTLEQLPPATSSRRLDFDRAQVLTLRSFPPQHVLRVSGTKPLANMEVDLVPRQYIRQPEYWGIEVVGTLHGIGLPAVAPYLVSLRLDGLIGTRGIEVIGATRTEKIDLPGGDELPIGTQDANTFELSGRELQITFATLRRASGGPRLDVTHGPNRRQVTFERDEIHSAQSEVGLQLTVALERIPDADTLALTVTLPTIHLAGEREVAFRTFAVLTTIRGSIGGPALIKGALQSYRVVQLRGRARHVEE